MAVYRKLFSMRRVRIASLAIIVALIASMVVTMLNAQNKFRVLEVNFGSHPAISAVMQLSLNGRTVIDHSQKGRSESGPVNYMDGEGDALDFEVSWYDIFEDSGYTSHFRVQGSDLTIFGMSEIGSVDIVVGPGADVTVATLNVEVARLITQQRTDELAVLPPVPDIVLAELCADQLDAGSPLIREFKLDVERYKDTEQRAANDRRRARYFTQNDPLIQRCRQN